MRLNDKVRKISGLFMIMLVVGMILVTPALACPPNVQTEQDSSNKLTDCPACSLSSEYANYSDAKVETIELSEKEQKKATAEALSDESVSKLRDELIKLGYVSSIEEIYTMKSTTTTENETVTTTIVTMPFNGTNNDSAVIVFASNELGNAAMAGVANNGELTVLQYDSVTDQVQITGLSCDFCMWAVGEICDLISAYGCKQVCTIIATRIPHPAWIAFTGVTCWALCSFIVSYKACNWATSEVCEGAGLC